MRSDVDTLLRRCAGTASRSLMLRHGISRHTIDNELKSRSLVAAANGVYCRPWDANDIDVRERAATISLGRACALSHLTGLRRWGVRPTTDLAVHVSVPASRAPRGNGSLVIHRVTAFPPVVRLHGLVTVRAPTALVTSWPLLAPDERRASVIDAVGRRLVTPDELRKALDAHRRIPGRPELAGLLALLDDGCESELEIWGHLTVFDADGLRHGVRQKRVRVAGQLFRLDLAFEVERVAVELDGRQFHSSHEQRERDMRRDALLATAGWLTLRYSHRRLHSDVAGCRRDTLATLAARRAR